jgi:hypothetical protein
MCWQRHDQFDRFERAEGWSRPARDRRERSTLATPPDDLLVSDAERQTVIDDLREHTADGRLTLDEFEERVEEALHARTGAELRTVTRELPSLRQTPPSRDWRLPRLPVSPRLLVIAAVVAVALLAGVWWVLIPLWFVFGGCGGSSANGVTQTRQTERDDTVSYV